MKNGLFMSRHLEVIAQTGLTNTHTYRQTWPSTLTQPHLSVIIMIIIHIVKGVACLVTYLRKHHSLYYTTDVDNVPHKNKNVETHFVKKN